MFRFVHSPQRDAGLASPLRRVAPDAPREVTNQAGVHHGFEAHFGYAVEPLRFLPAAVASWPECATCVALRLDHGDSLQVIVPHGLEDLLSMTIRRNPDA